MPCSWQFAGRDIHIWTVRTTAPEAIAAEFEPVLAADEKDRAARFRFDRHRSSFMIARGTLRHLLGRYLDADPASLRFDYGSKGKPVLVSNADINFNVTHSGGLAAFAFTAGCELGIDLEDIRPLTGMESTANRFFCAEEAAEILSLPPGEREAAFFRCWTRKEAYIKATGDGLSAPLNEFRVTVSPDEPARLVHLAHDTHAAGAWTLHDLRLESGYASALAYRDRPRSLCVHPTADPTEFFRAA